MNMNFLDLVNESYDEDIEQQPKETTAVATNAVKTKKKAVAKPHWSGIPFGIGPPDVDQPILKKNSNELNTPQQLWYSKMNRFWLYHFIIQFESL